MGDSITIITSPFVNVRVTSNLSEFSAEKRFDRGLTVGELKGRLELITGASVGSMNLEAFNEADEFVCKLIDDDALLGSFTIEENYRIHVTDDCKSSGDFEDLSKVEKFQLSEDEYNKKSDSVRSFLMRNKLGKYNAEEQLQLKEEREKAEKEVEEQAKTITVGSRCQVQVQGEASRRGVVLFVGKTEFKSGWWAGIKYDEPVGKNDGSVGGKQYFEAPMKYGGFVRPACVEVGDFPEITFEEDEM